MYCSSLWNGFVDWDDSQLILENPLTQHITPRIFSSYDPELYIPVTLVTYQLEHAVFGFTAFLFHVDSLLLHIINGTLVFWLLTLLTKRRRFAFLCALVFVVHPLNVEAVAWVSARKELLAACFSFLSLIAYEKSLTGRSRRWFWASLAAFVLALLSKPAALLLPAILVLLEWRHGKTCSTETLRRLMPFMLIALIDAVIAVIGKDKVIDVLPVWQVILLAFRSATFSLEKLFVPIHLSAIYAPPELSIFTPSIALSILILIGLAMILWFYRRKVPDVFFGMIVWFLFLAPSFLAYEKANDVMLTADRYSYLPSIGWIFAVGSLLLLIKGKVPHMGVIVCTVIVACAFGVIARTQSMVWFDTESLFLNVLSNDARSPIALSNIGSIALDRGQVDDAISLSSEAIDIDPQYPDAYVNLGAALGRKKNYDEAEAALREAIRLNPRQAQAYFNLGGVEQMRGMLDQAVIDYRQSIALKPLNADAYFQLARVLLRQKKNDEARDTYLKALDVNEDLRGVAPELDALL